MSCWSVWWRRFIVAQQIKSIMSRFGAPTLFNAPFPPANGAAHDGNSAPWIKEAFHGKASHPIALYPHWGSILLCACARSALQIRRVRRSLQTGRLHPKKKKNTQAMLDVRGPAGVWALLQAKEDDGRAQEELKFTQERLYPRETLDSDGTLKVTQSWGSRDKVAPYSKCISCHLIWKGSIIYG